jgi:hypothetical protein
MREREMLLGLGLGLGFYGCDVVVSCVIICMVNGFPSILIELPPCFPKGRQLDFIQPICCVQSVHYLHTQIKLMTIDY